MELDDLAMDGLPMAQFFVFSCYLLLLATVCDFASVSFSFYITFYPPSCLKMYQYMGNFKHQVIATAESLNNHMSACHFSINERQVRHWRKKQKEIAKVPKVKKAACGHHLMFNALEKRLADWIQEPRLYGLIIMGTAIWMRELNLMKTSEFLENKLADFVASVGWCN